MGVADFFAGVGQPGIDDVHQRIPPVQRGHDSLQRADPDVSATDMGELVDQDRSHAICALRFQQMLGNDDDWPGETPGEGNPDPRGRPRTGGRRSRMAVESSASNAVASGSATGVECLTSRATPEAARSVRTSDTSVPRNQRPTAAVEMPAAVMPGDSVADVERGIHQPIVRQTHWRSQWYQALVPAGWRRRGFPRRTELSACCSSPLIAR
ncbi:MAG: hypothetical protein U0992_05985 [Planctomycetaceae bacterium]